MILDKILHLLLPNRLLLYFHELSVDLSLQTYCSVASRPVFAFVSVCVKLVNFSFLFIFSFCYCYGCWLDCLYANFVWYNFLELFICCCCCWALFNHTINFSCVTCVSMIKMKQNRMNKWGLNSFGRFYWKMNQVYTRIQQMIDWFNEFDKQHNVLCFFFL